MRSSLSEVEFFVQEVSRLTGLPTYQISETDSGNFQVILKDGTLVIDVELSGFWVPHLYSWGEIQLRRDQGTLDEAFVERVNEAKREYRKALESTVGHIQARIRNSQRPFSIVDSVIDGPPDPDE